MSASSSKSGGPLRLAARIGALLALCSVAFADPVFAQEGEAEEVPEVDPYTEGDPKRMEKLGYVSFGPFDWGDGHDTAEIVRVLGEIPLLWVETEHFRLGSSLPKYTIAEDREEKKRIRAELTALAKHLPGLKPKTKKLDRWLRLHLYAKRLEEQYQAFCDRLGLDEKGLADTSVFPGPHVGQKEKFCVLLLEKESGLARYTSNFLGVESKVSMRWSFHETGCMFF